MLGPCRVPVGLGHDLLRALRGKSNLFPLRPAACLLWGCTAGGQREIKGVSVLQRRLVAVIRGCLYIWIFVFYKPLCWFSLHCINSSVEKVLCCLLDSAPSVRLNNGYCGTILNG